MNEIKDQFYYESLKNCELNFESLFTYLEKDVKYIFNFTQSSFGLTQNQKKKQSHNSIQSSYYGFQLLKGLIDQIVDINKIKNKQIRLKQQDFNFQECIFEAIDVVKEIVLFKGVNLNIKVRKNVPIFIRSDPLRFQQLCILLLFEIQKIVLLGDIQIICSVSPSIENHIAIKILINAEEFDEKNIKKLIETDAYIKKFDVNEIPIFDKLYSQIYLNCFLLSKYFGKQGLLFDFSETQQGKEVEIIFLIENKNPNFEKKLNNQSNQFLMRMANEIIPENYRADQDQIERVKRNNTIKRTIKLKEQNQQVLNQVEEQQFNEENKSLNEIEPEISSNSKSDENFSSDESAVESQIDQLQKMQKKFLVNPSPDQEIVESCGSKEQRDSKKDSANFTFGQGRSSMIYSSLSQALEPNELLSRLDKMMSAKKNIKSWKKCRLKCKQCLIFEKQELDLYIFTKQLEKLGLTYDYVQDIELVKDYIKEQLLKIQQNQCCSGYLYVFIGIQDVMEELLKNEIMEIKNLNYAKFKMVSMSENYEFQNEKEYLKQFKFDENLVKPIQQEQILFRLAKFMK